MNPLNLLLSFPEGIAVFNSRLEAVFVNPAFYEVLKLSYSHHTGTNAQKLFSKTPELIKRLKRFFRDGTGYLNHDFVLQTGGSSLSLVMAINPVNFGGSAGGACVTAHSNFGKQELRNEHEKEEKIAMLSMMAAGLAHEIKNPLGGIRGVAQLIGREQENMAEYSEIIVKETERIDALVSELLALGWEKRQKRANVNVHQALDETLALQKPVLLEKNITVIRDYDPSLPHITGFPDRLRQLFLNLYKNAMESTGKGGNLRLRTRTALIPAPTADGKGKKSMMSIEFVDSGKGVDPEIAKYLFTPFITGKSKGMGLGLVLSLKIAREHGGTLVLENNHGAPGATAKIILPIS